MVVLLSGALVAGFIASAALPLRMVIKNEYLQHGLYVLLADLLAEGLKASFARWTLMAFGGLLLVFLGLRRLPLRTRGSRRAARCERGLHVAALCALLIHGLLILSVHSVRRDVSVHAPNVLLVVIDTLRADHLGFAGHADARTPVLDALAARSVVFERTYSAASWTRPAIASILTSETPAQHGITRENHRHVLTAPAVTMQEYFRDRGYSTAAIYANPHLQYGLDQQFDMTRYGGNFPAELVVDWTVEYLDGRGDEPFFLLLHLNDPHDGYKYHEGYSKHPPDAIHRKLMRIMPILQDGARRIKTPEELMPVPIDDVQLATLKDHYDAEIAYTDHHLGRVLDHLAALELEDDTIVIVTADHGEEFLDHGSYWHGLTLYEEVLRVPMIVHVPGQAARRVTEGIATVDLFPTVAELVEGQPVHFDGWSGSSLVPLMGGEPWTARPLLSMTGFRGELKYSLVFEDTKLIRYEDGEVIGLFDLASDPGERHDLSQTDPGRLAAMQGMLAKLLSGTVAATSSVPVELDEESLRVLRQLGYTGN